MIKQIFKIGRPVTGKELIGREKEVNELLPRAMGGQSMILVAPRRYGKTSILFEVSHKRIYPLVAVDPDNGDEF